MGRDYEFEEDNLPHLVSSFFDHQINETDREWGALQQRLRNDKEARRYYAECAVMQAQVAWVFSNQLETGAPVVLPSRNPGFFKWGLAGSTVLVLSACVLFFFIGFPGSRPTVARVMELVKVRWQEEAIAWNRNQGVSAGDRIRLQHGLLELELNSGVRVIVEGPASLELVSSDQIWLEQGRVFAKVPEQARGFSIRTPTSRAVDLGTEFGVYVDEQQTTDVHVVKGMVDAELLDGEGRKLDSRRLSQNKAAQFSSVIKEVPCRTNDFVKHLQYEKVIKESGPYIRLTFDEIQNGTIPNQVSDQKHAKISFAAPLSGQKDNQYLTFSSADSEGKEGSGQYVLIDSLEDLFAGDFTFEFWVRPQRVHRATLFRVFPLDPGLESSNGSVIELMDFSADDPRGLRFLLRNTRFNPQDKETDLYSNQPYEPGRWHHIVGVRSRTQLKLYLDGKLLVQDECPQRINQETGLIIGRHLPPDNELIVHRDYLGDLDEMLIYRRALSDAEIRAHSLLYQTAQ